MRNILAVAGRFVVATAILAGAAFGLQGLPVWALLAIGGAILTGFIVLCGIRGH